MKTKQSVYSQLEHLLAKEPSEWGADQKFREENAEWLQTSQIIALRVLTRLRELQLTQNDVAEKLNVSRQQVNKWMKGKENFTLETLHKLAKVVGLSVINLMDAHSLSVAETSNQATAADQSVADQQYTDVPTGHEPKVIPLTASSKFLLTKSV